MNGSESPQRQPSAFRCISQWFLLSGRSQKPTWAAVRFEPCFVFRLCRSASWLSDLFLWPSSTAFQLFCFHWLTESMEQIPSRDADSFSPSQEIPRVLYSWNFHYCFNKSLLFVPVVTQINPIHAAPFYLSSTLIISSHLLLGLSSYFPTKTPVCVCVCVFALFPTRATCPTHLFLV